MKKVETYELFDNFVEKNIGTRWSDMTTKSKIFYTTHELVSALVLPISIGFFLMNLGGNNDEIIPDTSLKCDESGTGSIEIKDSYNSYNGSNNQTDIIINTGATCNNCIIYTSSDSI